ncbi:hypothetical protein DSUL_150016 [Desulfovibrionales bacterium]
MSITTKKHSTLLSIGHNDESQAMGSRQCSFRLGLDKIFLLSELLFYAQTRDLNELGLFDLIYKHIAKAKET